jgi:tRNA (guanine-N7-)-methyltransferase
MRPIRSYVRREGRLTPAQEKALTALWPHYGLDLAAGPLDFRHVFGRSAPVTLEIGFGNGAALAILAARFPERDFVGIEVHRPGVGHLLRLLEDGDMRNVRVIREDAATVLAEYIPNASLDEVLLWFPDPWPKKRHHKRRLVQPEFVRRLRDCIAPGGRLHLATDWEDYAQHMLAMVESVGEFANEAGLGQFSPDPANRPSTRFEQRGRRLGHQVFDLLYRRI